MALVTVGNGSGWYLTVTLIDNGNDKSTKTYPLRAADETAAQIAVTAILAAVNAATGSVIANTSLSHRKEEDTFIFPASGVENQNIARIVVQLAGGTKKATLDIPAALPGVFVGTSGANANIVDLAATETSDYLDLYLPAGQVFISDGEDLDIGIEGRRVSSRKGFRG